MHDASPHDPPRDDASAATSPAQTSSTESVAYPTEHVVAIVDTPDQLGGVMQALGEGGFLASELEARCGTAAAERLAATTGRTGLLDGVLRLAERLGIQNDELAVKQRYEDAMRDGRYVVTVHAPTDERKAHAAALLREGGAHFVNYFGRLTRESLAP